MVRDALRDGHMEIIAVGGDGTINEAFNGFFEHGALVSSDATFSFVHNGNDSAICRKFGLLPGWRAGIEHLKQARVRKVDVGRVFCLSPEGAPASRYFLGAASFGLTGTIARAMGGARIARLFGHGFALAWHRMMALLRWRTCRLRLMADNYDEIAGIASVQLSPYGGLFDVEIAGGDSRRHILTSMKTPGRRLRSTRLTAAPTLDTSGPVAVETDGESAGVLPATFEIHPGAVNLRV
jgi:diacylglycerol kinase family enzyme